MPTPAIVARQCLAEDAAAALDEAVAVAKRRGHAQTTSLHAVSTLLSLPSSSIREACIRARSNACSPRLQLRALELSVGVALDRQSVLKSPPRAEEPPVSNSLMAAIKRSQANQKRHPDTFHLYQRQQLSSGSENFSSIAAVKVELKHFVMSILDDPIVSRVFGDAGFRTNEIKWAILNPIPVSRFFSSSATSRCPPMFLRSLSDIQSNKSGPNFPFAVDFSSATERGNENSRRVCDVLVKRTRRNPLLIGNCAKDALRCFTDCLKRNETGVLPEQIDGLSIISIESGIISELINGQLEERTVLLKFKEVSEMVKNCLGPGIILNCGDLKAFLDFESMDVVNYIVSELKSLLINSGGKLWVIGFLAGDDHYKKLLERFPSIETDWDLHLLPITTSSGGQSFKSSLMGSFIPFGGFFPMPSELEPLCTSPTKSPSLCNMCNDKYETEVSVISKGAPTDLIADKHLTNLSSWLQIAQHETSKKTEIAEAENGKTVLDSRVLALKRKWTDICQHVHQEDISKTKSQTFSIPSFSNVLIPKDNADMGSFLNGNRITSLSPFMLKNLQNNFLPKQNMPIACTSPPSGVSVTTDLGLGTLNASLKECRRSPNSREHCDDVRDFHEPSRTYENTSSQIIHSSPCSHQLDKHTYMKDLEYPWKVLAKKVFWQMDAIQAINQTLSRCRSGNGRFHSSKSGNVWFSFLGPDKVGKRKIAKALPEIVFGKKDNFLSLDLRLQGGIFPSNSIIDVYDLKHHDVMYGRKMIVDYLAEKLSKCSDSVIVLENVDKADIYMQNSLSQAVKTGKFLDSHGRDINVKNTVFVLTSHIQKVSDDLRFGRVASDFTEEKILEAKNLQMQILVNEKGYSKNNKANVSVIPSNIISNQCSVNKRKRSCQLSRSMIDLNLPVEDIEEDNDTDKGSYDDDDDNDSSQNSELWLGELLEYIDENVVFKPFDFDYLNEKILKEIDVRLKKIVGNETFLEIDHEVMLQILAAAWLTGGNDALEDWVENVLCSTIEEVRRRCNINSGTIMQLVPISGLVEKWASGLCLPTRINMN